MWHIHWTLPKPHPHTVTETISPPWDCHAVHGKTPDTVFAVANTSMSVPAFTHQCRCLPLHTNVSACLFCTCLIFTLKQTQAGDQHSIPPPCGTSGEEVAGAVDSTLPSQPRTRSHPRQWLPSNFAGGVGEPSKYTPLKMILKYLKNRLSKLSCWIFITFCKARKLNWANSYQSICSSSLQTVSL